MVINLDDAGYCYFDEFELRWRKEDGIVSVNWVRVPAEDKTIEIPE